MQGPLVKWLFRTLEKAISVLLILVFLLGMILFLSYCILTFLDQVIQIGQVFPFVTQVVVWGKDKPFLFHKSARFWLALFCGVGIICFILSVALSRYLRRGWLRRYGIAVPATVTRIGTNVMLRRLTYNGSLAKMAYVEAKWRDPETGRTYAFRRHIGRKARSRYISGGKILVYFDPRKPSFHYIEDTMLPTNLWQNEGMLMSGYY
jgi:hypothetical protein